MLPPISKLPDTNGVEQTFRSAVKSKEKFFLAPQAHAQRSGATQVRQKNRGSCSSAKPRNKRISVPSNLSYSLISLRPMDNELTRFARAFQNEDELIRSIASMFRRRNDVTGVAITDGTHERGKDVVFYIENAVGQRELHACVIKNVKIVGAIGATGASASAMTVFAQASQALANPYHGTSGQDEYVSHVYIMSPHEIPQSTIYSIQGSLRGNVSFCCGGQLLELFRKYWPDFLFDSGALGIYVTHLQNEIDKDDPVAVLFSEHSILGSKGALQKTYVQPTFHVTSARFRCGVTVPKTAEFLEALTKAAAEKLSSRLSALSNLSNVPHFWWEQGPGEDAEILATTLTRFAAQIRSNWDKAYLEYERTCAAEKRDLILKRDASLKIAWNSDSINQLSEGLTLCNRCVNMLNEAVKAANTFVKTGPSCKPYDLNSAPYLALCMVQEIAALAPALVAPHGSAQVTSLSAASLNDFKFLLITGAAGYGKSTFCYHYAKSEAEALIRKRSDLLPVYVKLHHLASHNLGSYQEEFFGTTELRALTSPNNVDAKKRVSRIRLYLDGLDEIPRIARQREILELAKQAAEGDPRIEIIITGRDYVAGPWLNWMPRIQISELDDAQVKSLVRGLLNEDSSQIGSFYSELAKVPGLEPLMHVPLLATLIVSVFRKRTALPENRVKLYEIFLDLMCGGWDLAKNVHRPTDFGSLGKLAMLTRLAGRMHINKRTSCTHHDIKVAIASSNTAFARRSVELTEEILQDGILIRSVGGYEFRHLSFQEYLAAKDLNDPTGRRQTQVLRWYLGGADWWYQTLSFFVGMLGKPLESEQWVVRYAGGVDTISLRMRRLLESIEDSYPGYKSENLSRIIDGPAPMQNAGNDKTDNFGSRTRKEGL